MTTPHPVSRSGEPPLRVLVVGHADHGKSSVVGRLFVGLQADVASHADAEVAQRADSPGAVPASPWAVSLPTAHEVLLRTPRRSYAIVDAPDPGPVLKAVLCDGLDADAALLVIDASEGVREPSRRYGRFLRLLGARQVGVIVNKMDLVDYEQEQFELIEEEFRHHLMGVGVEPAAFVPVSARQGDGLAGRRDQHDHDNMPWYDGPSVLELLDQLDRAPSRAQLPARFVCLARDSSGSVEAAVHAGTAQAGDRVVVTPGHKLAAVQAVEPGAAAGTVHVRLDPPLTLARGDVISHATTPPRETQRFQGLLYWSHGTPAAVGDAYVARIAGADTPCEIEAIGDAVRVRDLAAVTEGGLEADWAGVVTVRTAAPVAVDDYADVWATGRFTLFARDEGPSGSPRPGARLGAGLVRLQS